MNRPGGAGRGDVASAYAPTPTVSCAGFEAEAFRDDFAAEGLRPPVVLWEPARSALLPRALRFLFDYWTELPRPRDLPHQDAIRPADLRPALGNVMLLEALDGGEDFRYLVYGQKIALRSGFDMTGKTVSELPTGACMRAFLSTIYFGVTERRKPVFTHHGPPSAINATCWQRLMLPLADDDGTVRRILAGNVPGRRRRGRGKASRPRLDLPPFVIDWLAGKDVRDNKDDPDAASDAA